jgi:hypothetical protein
MAATIATNISLSDLPRAQATALQKKAKRLGIPLQEYIKQLISDDLELDNLAASQTLAKLSAPFRKALAGLSDDQLDAIARPARRRAKR